MKDWNEIKSWRKTRRQELIAARAAFDAAQRHAWNERITAALESGFEVPAGAVVGFCWPHKGEFDARFAVRRWREVGATAALPAVVDKKGPLQFRKWWPGAPMRKEVYDIPVPDGTEVLAPDIAIVPMNGFDGRGYRLGYGGGYFDRTLAALGRRVLAVGVTFEALRLETIFPQTHDIPMDFVVTEAGVYRAGGRELALIDAAVSVQEARSLMRARGLPRETALRAAAVTGGYSSPACSAHEIAPGYFGETLTMPDDELAALLNTLLEAERAGAKVLAEFLGDYERGSPAWRQVAADARQRFCDFPGHPLLPAVQEVQTRGLALHRQRLAEEIPGRRAGSGVHLAQQVEQDGAILRLVALHGRDLPPGRRPALVVAEKFREHLRAGALGFQESIQQRGQLVVGHQGGKTRETANAKRRSRMTACCCRHSMTSFRFSARNQNGWGLS